MAVYGINLFLMEARYGTEEARRRFIESDPPRFHRPSHDSVPDYAEYLTDKELATLRSRIHSYLATCRERRRKEI